MITSSHLATTLLYDMLCWWSLYLNKCVTALSSEDVGAPGATVTFSLDPILLNLEGGRYVGPLLPMPLAELVSDRRQQQQWQRKTGKGYGRGGSGGGGRGGGGDGEKSGGAGRGGAAGGGRRSGSTVRVQVRYDAHLPTLSIRDGEN